jgi:hypothetical protein
MKAPRQSTLPGPSSLFFLFLLVSSCIISQAAGLSVQFTDRSLSGPAQLDIYYVNGTHMETINTSSQINLDESVIIHVSPDRTRDYIDDPSSLLTDLTDFLRDNLMALIIVGFLVYLVVGRK